jgi:hypothetical protein
MDKSCFRLHTRIVDYPMADILLEKKEVFAQMLRMSMFPKLHVAKVQRVNREGVVFSGSKTAAGWKELAQLSTQPTARFVSR